MSSVPIISVTGTKGKTTTVAIIADVLQSLGKNTLKVDTTGHFVNGERKSSLDDSKKVWRLVPSVCPGRYLWEFHANQNLNQDGVAVLECSLGCSATSGLGYRYHKVGVFLNVFEDHLGSSDRIQSREDIAKAKEFIFTRLLHSNSYAVFNADDPLVVDRLKRLPSENINLIPFGLEFSMFDIDQHMSAGGVAITINSKKEVVLKKKNAETILANLNNIPWTFQGDFLPSAYNLMAAAAAVYGYFEGSLPDNIAEIFNSVRLDPYGGRLTLLKNKNGVKILADYAHEKTSLKTVAELARKQISQGNKVIGVVRLAHDRTDDLLQETGREIAPYYDSFVVYDKIDGYWRKARRKGTRFTEVDGRVSQILADSIKEINPQVQRIVREDEAMRYAAKTAKPGDMVVVIVNDDIERSIKFIQDSFEADFI
jgi:cyanophycin synthetase